MTYAEIYARRKALGMEHLSIEEFSRLYGDNPDFAAGTSGGTVGQVLKATSAGVDRFLGATGLPEATGEIFARIPQVATLGNSGPSEAWRDAGRGIPRGAATTAAAVLTGGVTGAVAMGGLTGVDVYEKTDSPLAGSVGALIGMATPLAGQLAGRGAAGVATSVLPRVFSNEVTKAAVTRGVTVSAPGVFKSAATRAVEFAGQQAGYLGAGLLTQASTGAIAAPDGQGWEAFKAPFTTENIVMSAATNLPFMANDIMQVRAQNRVVRGEADAAAVAARYDEIDRLRGLNAPRVEGPSFTSSSKSGLGSYRGEVDARESRLGLPWTPQETPAQRSYRELVAQSRLNASMPRTSPDAVVPPVKVERVVTPISPDTDHVNFVSSVRDFGGIPKQYEVDANSSRIKLFELSAGGERNGRYEQILLPGTMAGKRFNAVALKSLFENGVQLTHETSDAYGTVTTLKPTNTQRSDAGLLRSAGETSSPTESEWGVAFRGAHAHPDREATAVHVVRASSAEEALSIVLRDRLKKGDTVVGAPYKVASELRSVAKTAPATVVAKLADAAALPVEQRLIADDPQVKYAAAAEVTGVSADDAVARITTKFDAGEDDSVATIELAQQLHAEATEAIAVQRRNEDRAAELSLRVAPVDDVVLPSAAKLQSSAEQTAAFDDALRPFAKNAVVQAKLRETLALSRDSTQLNPDVILQSAVLRWKQESPTADAESLVQALRGADKLLRKEGVDPKSLMSVSEIRDDGTVVLQKGKAKHFATRDEAEAARAKMQTDDLNNEFQWSVIRPQGADYFTITRRTYFRTAIGGEVTDLVMDSATAGLVPAADAPRMIVKERARRPEEHAAVKIIDRAADGDDAVEQFVAKVPRDVVEELGTGDGDTGAVRLEALLRLRAATTPAEKARWADVVRTSFGGDKALTNAWVKDATTQELLTAWDAQRGVVAVSGKAMKFGGNVQPAYVGQRRTLSELLRTVGLDDTWTDEAARLVTLYDNSDVAYAQIMGATDAAGLFTVQRDGQKLVWLSQQNNPRRTLFALTHELNGHALWQAMRDGRLDAETTNRMQQFESLVKESSPETNRVMLQELWRHLPDDVRKDSGLKKLVDLASSDPEEVLANINAVASLNLVHSSKSVWRDMLTYLPKPLADVLVAMARMSRRMFESINGLMFSREHGWNAGAVNAKARAELGTYIDSLYGVLRYDRERSAQAAKALRMGLLTDSEARFTAMQSPEYWVAANADEATVLQAMGLVNEAETKPNNWLPEGSVGFTRMFGGAGAFAVKYPELRRLLNTGSRREAESALLEKAAMAELGFERQGFKIVAGAPESNPILRVEQVVRLAEQRDAIIQRANVTQKPVEQLIAEGDAKVMATLKGMSAEDQTLVRSALAQHESFNKKTNALALEKKYDRLAFITAEALLNKDANMSVATAETLARELIAARRGGKPFAGNEPNAVSLASFVDTAAQGIEDAHAFFVQRPYYVSYRRFGEFSVTVKFSDKRPELARSFDTQEARDTWLAEFDGDPRATVKLHKNKFRTKNALGNEALEILREHESKNLEALTSALVVNGMDADTAKSLVGRFSTYGEVQRELAAKAVPGKAPHRRFVAGYEELNTTEQQMQYLQLLSHGLTKAVGDAEFNMLMAGPQGRAFVDRDTIRKAWEQYKSPDSETVKNVRKASYLMYMLLHPINMVQDAAAPLIGALPAWMINDGAGVVQAHKLIGAAMADAKSTKRTTADEQAMLKWFRDSNQGLASYSDESNNDALSLHNLHAVANGRKTAAGLGEWLGQKASSALLHAKQFHRHATNYGMEAGMLAAYRWQRGKGLDHNAAVAAAFDFVMPAMAAQGKSGRAQGIWDAGVLKPVTASITSLQSFAMNTLFTAKGTFERAIGRVPGLTGKQRVDAGKAFVATLSLMAVTGGIMGVVGVAPALTLIDKVFGTNSREALADLLRGDDDDSYDDVVQQVAMHGALSVTGGPDFGSRFASQGFLGFNGYGGWSVETMLGTGYDLVKRVFTLPAALADEGAGALTRLAPQPFKRGLDAWKNDWEFRRKDGSLIDESTPWEQSLHAVLGVKPVRIANIQERDTWQRIDAQNDSDARAAWLDDMMSLMDDGRFDEVRQQTVQRAASRDGERPDMIAQKLAEQYVERLYGRMAGRRAGYNARLARTSPGDSMTEMQRLTLEDSVRQRLNMGFATSPAMVRRARDVDAIRALNPTMSVKSAREFIERRSGSNVLRGATYQRR